jgi:hypothetical protein
MLLNFYPTPVSRSRQGKPILYRAVKPKRESCRVILIKFTVSEREWPFRDTENGKVVEADRSGFKCGSDRQPNLALESILCPWLPDRRHVRLGQAASRGLRTPLFIFTVWVCKRISNIISVL